MVQVFEVFREVGGPTKLLDEVFPGEGLVVTVHKLTD